MQRNDFESLRRKGGPFGVHFLRQGGFDYRIDTKNDRVGIFEYTFSLFSYNIGELSCNQTEYHTVRSRLMNEPIDIEVVIDEEYIDPKVMILTKEKTQQVENIICAIENVPDSGFSLIPATSEDNEKLEFISQRDIVRIFTEGRKLKLQTDVQTYVCKSSLSGIEEVLNPVRFIRISHSEIINIYKVKRFDISIAGTIGVEFENGTKTWASRRCVKQIKNILKNR